MALILDTGVTYAVYDRSDRHHAAVRAMIETAGEMLLLPGPTLPEIDYLLRERVGPGASLALIDDITAGAFVVEDLTLEDYPRVRDLMDRYDDIGFVAAAVLATVERAGEPKLATIDHRHFAMMRPRHVEALELLP